MRRNRTVPAKVIFQLVCTETGETLSFLLSLYLGFTNIRLIFGNAH